MIPFVISPKEHVPTILPFIKRKIKGNFDRSPDHGYWVLVVDKRRNRFLIADESSEFHWLKCSDCIIRFCAPPKPVQEEPHPLPPNILEGFKDLKLQNS